MLSLINVYVLDIRQVAAPLSIVLSCEIISSISSYVSWLPNAVGRDQRPEGVWTLPLAIL